MPQDARTNEPPRPHRPAFAVLVPLLAIAALSVTIELGFALWQAGSSSPFEHRVPDPILGWRLEPGASYLYAGRGYRARVNYNAQGWRDGEHALAKPPGDRRVLVLGDSFMEAYTVDAEDAFHRQLQQQLSAQGQPAEVINMGVGGFGTLQSLLTFEHHGQAMQPDLVLLAFYFGKTMVLDLALTGDLGGKLGGNLGGNRGWADHRDHGGNRYRDRRRGQPGGLPRRRRV